MAAIGFGLLWGLMIIWTDISFLLLKDRNMVESDTNDYTASYSGRLFRNYYCQTSELKIFEKEVNKQLNTIIQRNKAELQAKINNRIMQQSPMIGKGRN